MSAVMSEADVKLSALPAVRLSVRQVEGVFLVGCLSSALATDLQQSLTGTTGALSPAAAAVLLRPGSVPAVIVVPGPHQIEWQRSLKETLRLVQTGIRRVLLLLPGTLRSDGSGTATAAEVLFATALSRECLQLTVLRLGPVLHPSRDAAGWWQCLQAALPLQFSSNCLDLQELVAVIEIELSGEGAVPASNQGFSQRLLSIPGRRRPCAEAALSGISESEVQLRRLAAGILRKVGIGWLLGVLLRILSVFLPGLRDRLTGTMCPRSRRDLVGLCNRHTRQQIQLAGCNHGVRHFGWKFPGKTVVSTTAVQGRIRVQRGIVTVDAGVTLKAVMERLGAEDRELPVTPNFSWISMGTCFFVPVHGSGSRMSTLGDAIQRVLLYDWEQERFFAADRGDRLFEEAMYNRRHPWLLLRLTLVTQPQQAFGMKERQLEAPTAEQVLEQFEDPQASHVEIRKSRAADSEVVVRAWQVLEHGEGGAALPRDQIGRIWDRLEETPIASSLFHWFVRTYAFHVELILTADEFRVFWAHHRTLPLSKIQLRKMRQDGMKHSACCVEDRISVDLFMLRGNRDVFCRFISEALPGARSNPGKQSF